jgi:hypothetical protein
MVFARKQRKPAEGEAADVRPMGDASFSRTLPGSHRSHRLKIMCATSHVNETGGDVASQSRMERVEGASRRQANRRCARRRSNGRAAACDLQNSKRDSAHRDTRARGCLRHAVGLVEARKDAPDVAALDDVPHAG